MSDQRIDQRTQMMSAPLMDHTLKMAAPPEAPLLNIMSRLDNLRIVLRREASELNTIASVIGGAEPSTTDEVPPDAAPSNGHLDLMMNMLCEIETSLAQLNYSRRRLNSMLGVEDYSHDT